MSDENDSPQRGQKRSLEDSALTLPARKKAGPPDYWRLKGRHIGRTMHIFINVGQLLLSGLQLDKDLALQPANGIEKYPAETRLQYEIYSQVLRFIPELEEGLTNGTIGTDRLAMISARLQTGVNNARSDDVKGLKAAIVEWIAHPVEGLKPPISPKYMIGRGWHHDATGKELCPAGLDWNDKSTQDALRANQLHVSSDQWPICFYLNGAYDPEHPWIGLLRGRLLMNAYKHIFTSPSSVDNSNRATKSSNSAINGMTKVTVASVVYVATLVRFALGDRPTFTRNDTVTDSQSFYNVLLSFLTNPHERENVNQLLAWWNQQIFPHAVATMRVPTAKSALAMCLQDRMKRITLGTVNANTSG